jgi:hypothetical protein
MAIEYEMPRPNSQLEESSSSRCFSHRMTNRRHFLSTLALAPLAARGQEAPKFPPTRIITKGPGFHWFAYYDKLQFSPDNRFVLSNKVNFEHRSPTGDDVIEVGMVDLQEKDKWIPLGKSNAWNWQQGCMLQWIPGTTARRTATSVTSWMSKRARSTRFRLRSTL